MSTMTSVLVMVVVLTMALVVSPCYAGTAAPTVCVSFANPVTNLTYNLLPMELVVGNYIFNDASNNVTYYFNVCANVWPPAQCGTLSGACMLQSNSGTWSSLGNQTELQVAPYVPNAATDGVTVTYPHGAYECQPGVFASTQLSIACDQNDSDGTVHSVTVSEACVFQVAMSSRYGCGFVPSTGHSLVWWMLVVGLPVVTGGLVLVLLVVVGAWLYARHKQQYEQL